jgi:Ras-related protein Rab-2A
VIDVSESDAFNHASKWLKEYNNLKSPNSIGMPVIIGNKTDLERAYNYEEGEQWANDNGCLYWEMSAKNNDNTSGLLYFVGNNIFNHWDGESKVAGVTNNVIKEKIEIIENQRNNLFNTCCRIV